MTVEYIIDTKCINSSTGLRMRRPHVLHEVGLRRPMYKELTGCDIVDSASTVSFGIEYTVIMRCARCGDTALFKSDGTMLESAMGKRSDK